MTPPPPAGGMRWSVWRGEISKKWYAQLIVMHRFNTFQEAWAWIDLQVHAEPS